jgi:glycosyltransferase involved in cell wall biosynthesis
MTPLVTVVIPTYNRPWELGQALASLRAQTLTDLEVIVVNDGGDTVDAALADEHGLDVRVLNLAGNSGPSAARNAGIDAARGRYLGFLDDDDLYLPHHLSAAVGVLESAAADMVYVNATVVAQRAVPGEPAAGTLAFDIPFNPDFLAVTNFIPTSAVVCRNFRDLGVRFDASLRVEEDWELWLHLQQGCGFRIHNQNQSGVIYHRIPGSGSATASVLGDIAVHQTFYDCYQTITKRWPVADQSPAGRYRDWMHHVYQLVFDRLENGTPPDHHWYERMLAVLYDGFTGTVEEDTLSDRLVAAVDAS